MRTLATKKPSNQDSTHRKLVRATPKPIVRSLSTGLKGSAILQRKPGCACGGGCPSCQEEALLQTKLKISEPGDEYEQEADRVADQVMRMPEPAIQLQTELEEEDIEPDETGMPKRESGVAGLNSAHTSNIRIPRESGHPLTTDMRDFMEQRFGYDFSKVRLHTNPEAEKSAQKLKARAYTIRENIYFNEGQYTPGSSEGRKLLAHELTHVIQQSARSNLLEQNVQRQSSGSFKAAKRKKKRGGNVCSAGNCPQGKQRKVVRNDCRKGEPANKNRFITDLNVSLSTQELEVVWSDGTTETWDCSPNPSAKNGTPRGADVVGKKCSINHTNKKKDGMAWFTGFKSKNIGIGFHNSQRVGKGIYSHGCVRVCCNKAKIINKNTWTGKTKIMVASRVPPTLRLPEPTLHLPERFRPHLIPPEQLRLTPPILPPVVSGASIPPLRLRVPTTLVQEETESP